MKNIIFIFLLFCSSIFALNLDPLAGRGGAFLRLGMGTESQSMANASAAHLSPSIIPAYFNPAMSVLIPNKTLIHSGIRLLSMGRRSGYISILNKIPPRMAFNIALLYAGDNSIPIYDNDEAYDFEGGYLALGTYISLAYKINRSFSIGFNTTIIHESMMGDAENPKLQMQTIEVGNLDLSLYYKINKKLAFGINAKNLLSIISWEVPILGEEVNLIYNDTLPINIITGFSYKGKINKRNIIICYDLNSYLFSQKVDSVYANNNKLPNFLIEHKLGIKYEITPSFPIYLGYTSSNEFATGLGFVPVSKLKNSQFNYSVKMENGSNGFSHEIGWTFKW